jgi:membrane protein
MSREAVPVRRNTHLPVSGTFTETPAGRALDQAIEDDVPGLAAELAYRAALAMLPFLLMLAALPSVVGSVFHVDDITQRLTDEADSLLSQNSADMMRTLIEEVGRSQGGTAFVFGLLGTIWAGSMTTSALRKALNRVYKFDDQTPFLIRKLTEFGLTIVSGLAFFIAIMSLVLGPSILGGQSALANLVSLLLALAIVLAAVSLLYWLAPAGEHHFRWVTRGALLFGGGWLAFSLGFSVYLSRFGMINHVYGSLGAMIVLLIWLYGSNFFLLLGAELNVALAQDRDPEVPQRRVSENA